MTAEKIRRTEANTELRKAYHERIAQLRLELQEHERAHLQAKKSVEAAQSAMRVEARGLDGERDLIQSLQEEREGTAREINALITELEGLATQKQRIGSAAEGLHWQLEGLRQQAEEFKGEMVDQLHQQQAAELHMKKHEEGIKAEMEGLLVMLHAHQEEKTKMGIRQKALAQRCGLLRSRYEDMMAALSRQVYGPEGNAPTAGGQQLMLIDSSESGAPNEGVTPEELQAHMMLAKAQEKDELQRKGDALDTAIVAAEKDLRQLSVAVQKLQESYSTGRALVREGHSTDSVFFGRSNQLMIADGPQTASPEEQDLLSFVRSRLESNDGEQLQTEIAQWSDRIASLNRDLEACRVQEQRVQTSLGKAAARLSEVQAQCNAKERQFQELSRECAVANALSEKARTASFQKQASLLKKSSYNFAASQLADADRISEAVRRLVSATSGHSSQCFYDMRALADKFGVPVDASAFEPVGKAPIISSTLLRNPSAGSSAAKRGQSATSRMSAINPNLVSYPAKATRALVQAFVVQQGSKHESLSSYRDPQNSLGRSLALRGTSAHTRASYAPSKGAK